MSGIRSRTVLVAAATLLLVLLPAAAPVTAGRELGTRGLVGRHRVVDTATEPGAACGYVDQDGDMVLATISVRPPVVYARDRTGDRDRQRVGWRVQLMGWVPEQDEPWQSVLVPLGDGPLHVARATDATPAPFANDTITVHTWARAYEVRVKLVWFAPNDPDRVVGRSRHSVDRYAIEGADDPASSCIAQVY